MNINHILFDLDNTLYPSSQAIDQGITFRMLSFTANFLGITYQQAVELRRNRLPLYGTTLEWLQKEHGLQDINQYFEAVHPPEEINELEKDSNLRQLLISLNLPMTILTNAPMRHAKRVLDFFEITDLFMGIHDIESNNFKGKPYASSYKKAVEESGFTIQDTIFFDDHKKYTDGFRRIGGNAILVCQKNNSKKPTHPLDTDDSFSDTIKISSVYEIPDLLKRC